MKRIFFLIVILCSNSLVISQNNIVELAISYDSQFADMFGSDIAAEAEISNVIDEVNNIYAPLNLFFQNVAIERFGFVDLSGNVNGPGRITGAWLNANKCYQRDMVLHFTGSDLSMGNVNGEVVNSGLCKSNNTDYFDQNRVNNFAVIVKHARFHSMAKTTAHELAHGMGLSHESETFCGQLTFSNTVPFLCCCGQGAPPGENVSYVLSTEKRNSLDNILNNSNFSGCTQSNDFDPNVVCTEFLSGFQGDREIKMECGEGVKEVKLFIKNDQSSRSFRNNWFILAPWSDLRESISSPDFDILSSIDWHDQLQDKAKINFGDFNLSENEIKEITLMVNYDNIVNDISQNDVIALFSFKSSQVVPELPGQNNTTGLAAGFIAEDRSIVLPSVTSTSWLLDKISEKFDDAVHDITELEILITGELNVDEDLTLDGIYNIKMAEGSRINVINNSTFTLNNNMISPCNDERWEGIYVESGSNIDFMSVQLHKGVSGIKTENNTDPSAPLSDIMLDNVVFDDFTKTGVSVETKSTVNITNTQVSITDPSNSIGIHLSGNVSMTKFEKNTVDGAKYGVRFFHCPYYYDINELTVSNCQRGLMMVRSPGVVHNSIFSNNDYSIYMVANSGMIIENNEIGFNKTGVHFSSCFQSYINDNTIGLPSDFGDVAVNIKSSNRIHVNENSHILSKYFGIRGINSNVSVIGNPDITVIGVPNTTSGPVSIIDGNYCQVRQNYLFGIDVGYGIESNNSFNSYFANNGILVSSNPNLNNSAAIRAMGSISDYIIKNEIQSSFDSDGMLSQNSSVGEYDCNIVFQAINSLSILSNSESQIIKGNELGADGTNLDMLVRSRIGPQKQHGNDFYSGNVQADLSLDDLEASVFEANSNDAFHLPTNPDPLTGWFDDIDKVDHECTGIAAGPTNKLFDDNDKLCAFYEHFSKLYESNKNLYYVKLMHILKYNKSKGLNVLPECISEDSLFNSACNIIEIVDNIYDVSQVNSVSSENEGLEDYFGELNSEQNKYFSSSEEEKVLVFNEIKNLVQTNYGDVLSEVDKDQTDLVDIKEGFDAVLCEDVLIQKIKSTWLTYLDYLLSEDLVEDELLPTSVLSNSLLCSDNFGDQVHLARALASIYNSHVYYDNNDGCSIDDESTPRSVSAKKIKTFNVFPNPNSGSFIVEFLAAFTGVIDIFNAEGKLLHSEKVDDSNRNLFTLNHKGLCFIKTLSSTGEIDVKKMMIID